MGVFSLKKNNFKGNCFFKLRIILKIAKPRLDIILQLVLKTCTLHWFNKYVSKSNEPSLFIADVMVVDGTQQPSQPEQSR